MSDKSTSKRQFGFKPASVTLGASLKNLSDFANMTEVTKEQAAVGVKEPPKGSQAAQETVIATKDVISFSDVYNEITLQDPVWYNMGTPHTAMVWIKIPPPESVENVSSKGLMESIQALQQKTNPFLESATEGYFETRPNHFRSFRFERFTQGIGRFTIVLFDNNFQEIETKLVRSKGVIAFKYGYTTNENTKSPWIVGKVFNYNIKFFLEGTQLHLSGLATGYHLNTFITWDETTQITSISETVEALAKKYNFSDYIIEPTKKLLSSQTFMELTKLENANIPNLGGSTTLEYIVNQLVPHAYNEQEKGGYAFFIEDRTEGPRLHFHRPPYSVLSTSEQKSLIEKAEEQATTTDKIPTFTMYKNPLSPVLDFQPNWMTSMAQLAGGSKTFAPIVNLQEQTTWQLLYESKDFTNIGEDKGTNRTSKENTPAGDKIVAPETDTSNPSEPDLQKAKISNEVNRKILVSIGGKLRVVGSTKFKICQAISVLIYLPRQFIVGPVLPGSKVHWISGLFRILGMTDIIENGNYITELTLGTAGRSVLATDKYTDTFKK